MKPASFVVSLSPLLHPSISTPYRALPVFAHKLAQCRSHLVIYVRPNQDVRMKGGRYIRKAERPGLHAHATACSCGKCMLDVGLN
jgi:hypothetical protein